ncbi:MAG: SH3-like domain-containing protein [Pseudomonadota bacterium]
MSATAARFKPGEVVRVRRAFPPGHVRAPIYVRGRAGTIERDCGDCVNAEERAFGRPGLPKLPLYRVRFRQHELWSDYAGPAGDSLEVEIYANWLEPA